MELIQWHRSFKGEQHFYRHESDLFKTVMDVAIYLPVATLKGKQYTQLYYLPELGHSVQETVLQSAYQNIANRYDTMVIVPDLYGNNTGDRRALLRSFLQNKELKSAYLCSELPTHLGSLFQQKDLPAIMGYGFGGSLALLWSWHHPFSFRSASAFAPWAGFSKTEYYTQVFSEEDLVSMDPVMHLEMQKDIPLPIWIDQGEKDELLNHEIYAADFAELLQKHSKNHIHWQWHKQYNHSYFFVQSLIREHLVFHADHS